MDTELMVVIIAQILGVISWLFLLYSYTKEDIDELLYLQILVCVFDVASYLLLGADSGLLICLVELIKTVLYYKTTKDKLIFRVSLIAYALIALLTIKTWYAILPVLGSIFDSFGTSKDSKWANICSIISNTLWTIYDVLILSYIGAFNDITVVLCNIGVLIFGYSRIMHISKFRIVKYNYLTKKTIDKIYKLDEKTYGKENTWDKKYQMDVYKRNKDSFFAVKYKHEFAGYINYLNIKEEEYERLKRVRKLPSIIELNQIIEFKPNRKTYLLIESINTKKEYEKDQTINLICKKLDSFIKLKHKQKIYIHGILAFTNTKFEEDIYLSLGFKKIKSFDNNTYLYELSEEDIRLYFINKNYKNKW